MDGGFSFNFGVSTVVNLSTCHPFYQVVASRQHTTTSKRAYLEATQTNQVCFKPKLGKNSSGAKSNNLGICSDDVGVFFLKRDSQNSYAWLISKRNQ